jgi:hypothetical protein
MPCSRISSDSVALGPVTALQSNFDVWGRLAQSGGIWGRWYLVWSWFAASRSVGSVMASDHTEMRQTEQGARIADSARL